MRGSDSKRCAASFTIFSETGTEGGLWAFQDERFIARAPAGPVDLFVGKRVFDAEREERAGTIRSLEELRRETPTADPNRPYDGTDEYPVRATVAWDDGPIEEHRPAETLLVEQWDRRGLHILSDGDRLTIFRKDRPALVAWKGTIRLRNYAPFTQTIRGYWIRADQVGISRKRWARWFFDGHPAELIPADT